MAQRLSAEEARGSELEDQNEELEQRSDDLEQRNDALEARLDQVQHELNMRDPEWRARFLQRCRDLGIVESNKLCARLFHAQSWWEWASAGWRNAGAAKEKPQAPAPAARAVARPAPANPIGVPIAAPTAAPSPTAAQEAESSVTITKPDGTRVRMVYDHEGGLSRTERVE